MPRVKWVFDSGGLNTEDQEEWDNLVSGKRSSDRPLKEVLEDSGVSPEESLHEFVQGLPEQLRDSFIAATKKEDASKILAYVRSLLRVTELLEKQNFEPSVTEKIKLVLKHSAGAPDGFRSMIRAFQGSTECLIAGPLPYGVYEVPEVLLQPPRRKLLHIASIEDPAKRIEAYWDDSAHEFWSVDTDGDMTRTLVYDVITMKRDDMMEDSTIAESLLRLGIAKKIGHMHYYAHLMDHLTMLRKQYLEALTLMRDNWTSPGIEVEIRSLLETVAKMHPIFYIDKHAKDVPRNMVYLGTWADPGDRISVPLFCNLDGTRIRIGDDELPVTTAAKRQRATSVPLVSNMVFATLAVGHAVGLIAKCPEALLREDEQAGGK